MAKSIMQQDDRCYLCGRIATETHHVLEGPNRKHSERYGLTVRLCHDCHTGDHGAQYDREKNLRLKREAQQAFEKTHTREEWMSIFMRNYLD